MYLEERVEQLEHLAVDYGRQIESVVKGLAQLTTGVRVIRKDVNAGFERVDERFVRVDEQFAEVNRRFDEMRQDMQSVQQTQQLILKILTERL